MSQVGAPSASESVCSEISIAASTHATIGRSGLKRIATTPPTTAPMPPAVRIAAQAPAPPSSLVRDRRAEHDPAGEREVADPEEEHRRPEPRPRGELLPALPQLGEEPGRRRLRCAAEPACDGGCPRRRRSSRRRAQVRSRGCRGRPRMPPMRRAEDAHEIPRHPLERVRLLESLGRDRLRDEPDLRRDDEARVRGRRPPGGRRSPRSPPAPERTQAAVAAWAAPWTSDAPTSTRLRGSRSERTPPPTTTSAWTPWRTANTMPSAVADADVEHREGERDTRRSGRRRW